jgi:prepilin-type N-terminal cleavage/methylation domain-containing protein
MKIKTIRNSEGFTIIELMIALSILSVILVMSTVIMIRINHIYTKGVTMANLQNTSRNLVSDISSALQFTGDSPACYAPGCNDPANLSNEARAYCIGSTRFTYVKDASLGTDGFDGSVTPHVLWKDTMLNSNTCKPLDLTVSGTPTDTLTDTTDPGYEMVPEHVRVVRFDINQTAPDSGIFNVTLWTAYGDDDLIKTSPSLTCDSDKGSEFCALSKVSTTVVKRIQ